MGLALGAPLSPDAQQLPEICSGVGDKISIGVALLSNFRRSVPAYQNGAVEIVSGVHIGAVAAPGRG